MESASKRFDAKISALADWRGKTLAQLRRIVHEADPEIVEEWKWMTENRPGTPTFERAGIICTGEVYKDVVKTTFAQGAALDDPAGLFNSSLEGNVRRAIDFHEGEKINEPALKKLVRAAVALNLAKAEKKTTAKAKPKAKPATSKRSA
ncbi:MAG: DUF1801 domain-containing protein [Acidobacteriaceae bacterium]